MITQAQMNRAQAKWDNMEPPEYWAVDVEPVKPECPCDTCNGMKRGTCTAQDGDKCEDLIEWEKI